MKKLLKLVTALTVILVLNSVCFAATTLKDVKGTKYEEAVTNLIEVGLVNGFEDSTYRPKETVTRAQMAKMLVIALGHEGELSAATAKKSMFSDMKTSHWAYGYINIASENKIINGYLDGTFAPDDKVSFAEATAMIIRALGYDDEVIKGGEAWPANYVNYAKKLNLYDSVGTITTANANNGADRGNVALLMWNMLRTGVCTVTGQNANGLIYGQGTKMINKYTKYAYFNNITMTISKFDDDFENATVILEDKDTKATVTMSGSDAIKYFGREIDVLYNTSTKKVISIAIDDSLKTETGTISKTPTSKKLYIDDDTYTMPSKDNVLLYGIEEYDEAIEATIVKSGSTLKAVILKGAVNVQLGLVTDNDVTVSKKDGIKIKKLGSSTATSYALADEDDVPEEYSVILYYLNSNNEIGIIKEVASDDAYTISSLTTSKIKFNSKTYTYDSSTFDVVAATTSSLKTLAFKSIDDEEDKAYAFDYLGKTYLVIFTDSADNSKTQKQAYDDLKAYIKTVEGKESKEASYSQDTFEPFLEALKNARTMTSSSTLAKINAAHTKLQDTYSALKSVTSTSAEGKIAKARATLRALVDGTAANAVKDKALYTTASYSTFEKKYSAAKTVLSKTTNDLDDVEDATTELKDAINKLEKLAETQEHKDALARLNAAIESCSSVQAESNYTAASYKTYDSAKTAANTAKTNAAKLTAAELTSKATALENAISNLEFAIDELIDEINELLVESTRDLIPNEATFVTADYNSFKAAYDVALEIDSGDTMNDIKTALSNLKKTMNMRTKLEVLSDYLSLIDNSVIQDADAIKALSLGEASSYGDDEKEDVVDSIEAAAKEALSDLIKVVTARITEMGESGDGSLDIVNGNTKKVLSDSKSTVKDIVDAYDKLAEALEASYPEIVE